MRLGYLLLALWVLLTAQGVAADLKVVYIDENYVLKSSQVLKQEQQKIDTKYKRKLDALGLEQKTVMGQMKKASANDADKLAIKLSQIQDNYAKINESRTAEVKLIRNNYALTEESVVKELRKREGYSFVLDNGYMWAFDPKLNISDKVISMTDKVYRKKFK